MDKGKSVSEMLKEANLCELDLMQAKKVLKDFAGEYRRKKELETVLSGRTFYTEEEVKNLLNILEVAGQATSLAAVCPSSHGSFGNNPNPLMRIV